MFFLARGLALLIVLNISVNALAARLTCSNALAVVDQALAAHPVKNTVDIDLGRKALKKIIEHLDPNRIFLLEDEAKVFANPSDEFVEKFLVDLFHDKNLDAISEIQQRANLVRLQSIDFLKTYPNLKAQIERRLDAQRVFDPKAVARNEQGRQKRLLDLMTQSYKYFLEIFEDSDSAYIMAVRAMRRILSQDGAFDKDILPEMVLDSIVGSLDPHSGFKGQEAYAEYKKGGQDFSMGIGVSFVEVPRGYLIAQVFQNSPAEEKGLHTGDLIHRIDGKIVAGMASEKFNELLPSAPKQKVELEIYRKNKILDVTLISKKVDVAPERVTSKIRNTPQGKIAEIRLEDFYNGSAADVAEKIRELKKENIDGLVLNLVDNRGGALRDAIDITGLFLGEAPVVGVAGAQDNDLLFSNRKRALWKGPLVIVIGNHSASASELVSGSLQDYNRALIVGSRQSFGKGTVQFALPFVQISPEEVKMAFELVGAQKNISKDNLVGGLKITHSRFYRAGGRSTQLVGVESQVTFPEIQNYMEKDYENAIPTDQLEPMLEEKLVREGISDQSLTDLKVRSAKRTSKVQWRQAVKLNDRFALESLYSEEALNILEDYMSQNEKQTH